MTVNYLWTTDQAKELGPPWIFRPACCSQEEKIHMQPVKGFNLQIHAADHSQGRQCLPPGTLSLTAAAQIIISKRPSRLHELLDRPASRYTSGAHRMLLPGLLSSRTSWWQLAPIFPSPLPQQSIPPWCSDHLSLH